MVGYLEGITYFIKIFCVYYILNIEYTTIIFI